MCCTCTSGAAPLWISSLPCTCASSSPGCALLWSRTVAMSGEAQGISSARIITQIHCMYTSVHQLSCTLQQPRGLQGIVCGTSSAASSLAGKVMWV